VRLHRYWEDVILKLPADQIASYRAGIVNVGEFHCSTSALPRHVAEKWAEMTGGARILERYGGIEFGNVFANFINTTLVPVSWNLDLLTNKIPC
jgi:malonyl-CoA/methylmalonyl-CoA synthetase